MGEQGPRLLLAVMVKTIASWQQTGVSGLETDGQFGRVDKRACLQRQKTGTQTGGRCLPRLENRRARFSEVGKQARMFSDVGKQVCKLEGDVYRV